MTQVKKKVTRKRTVSRPAVITDEDVRYYRVARGTGKDNGIVKVYELIKHKNGFVAGCSEKAVIMDSINIGLEKFFERIRTSIAKRSKEVMEDFK